jgi:CRP/FNR family transcriptional regulator, cyclic AMP receptor protein
MGLAAKERGFLSVLSAPLLARLTAEASRKSYTSGQLIHCKGERTPGFSMVRKGRVRLGAVGPSGNFLEFGLLRAGDVYGEMTVINRIHRIHDAYAVGATTVDHLTAERFDRAVAAFPEMQLALLRLMARRLHYAYQRIDDILRLPLIDRVAQHLLDSGRKSSDPAAIALKQADLAEAMGASRVSVSKSLAQLAADGLVRTGYGRIEIADRAGLGRWLAERGNSTTPRS